MYEEEINLGINNHKGQQGIFDTDNFHREQAVEIGDKIWKQLTELPF